MPIYEYACERCGSEFERLVLAGPADDRLRCPRCGATEARRLVSTFGVLGGRSAEEGPARASCCAGGGCTCRG